MSQNTPILWKNWNITVINKTLLHNWFAFIACCQCVWYLRKTKRSLKRAHHGLEGSRTQAINDVLQARDKVWMWRTICHQTQQQSLTPLCRQDYHSQLNMQLHQLSLIHSEMHPVYGDKCCTLRTGSSLIKLKTAETQIPKIAVNDK